MQHPFAAQILGCRERLDAHGQARVVAYFEPGAAEHTGTRRYVAATPDPHATRQGHERINARPFP